MTDAPIEAGDLDARRVAVVRSNDDLLELGRRQVQALRITYDMLDRYTGFTQGFWSKAFSISPYSSTGKRGARRGLSAESFDALLVGICCDFVAVENPEKVARLKAWMEKKLERREAPPQMRTADTHKPVIVKLSLRHMRKLSKMAAHARRTKLSKEERARLASNAAKARWHKPKITQIAPLRGAPKISALRTSEKNETARGSKPKELRQQHASFLPSQKADALASKQERRQARPPRRKAKA